MRRLVLLALAVQVTTMTVAHAQMPVIDPGGNTPAPTGPPPNPYGYPVAVPAAPQQAPPPAPTAGQPPSEGLYLGPAPTEHPAAANPDSQENEGSEIPEVHVIQKGDTLWDICKYYYNDPWRWPEVWSYNPSITNPHWIYPGNIIRLRSGTASAAGPTSSPTSATLPPPAPATPPAPIGRDTISLRDSAFISLDVLDRSGTVRGSSAEKEMISLNDEIFVDYPPGKPPEVGTRYTIYAPKQDIIHPTTHKKIGAYVLIRGQVLINEVKKGRFARGEIVSVTSEGTVNRDDRVGPVATLMQTIEPVPATRNVEGLVVATIGHTDLAGLGQIVLLDHGQADGLAPGNIMRVVRRGDAYPPEVGDGTAAGEDDRRYPDTIVGEIAVIEVGKTTAIGFVTRSKQEIELADHVVITKPLAQPEAAPASAPSQ